MKVKELIKQLKDFNPEARVFADSYEGKGINEILCLFSFVDNGDVILEHADQFDIKEEIDTMLDYYNDNYYDEVDAYQEMFNKGYTLDVLEKYYNKDAAEHMRWYCEHYNIN